MNGLGEMMVYMDWVETIKSVEVMELMIFTGRRNDYLDGGNGDDLLMGMVVLILL